MKRVLLISVLLNAVLAGALICFFEKNRRSSARREVEPAVMSAPHGRAVIQASEAQKPSQSFDWRTVESNDYKKYIANLRAIGCPEETIRDIITADVNKLFASRVGGLNKFQFWKADNFWANPDRVEKSVAVWKEKRALLKELLGVEPEGNPTDIFAGYRPIERMLDFLPPARQGQVMEIYTLAQAKMTQIGRSATAGSYRLDMRARDQVQKEMEAQLASILSPQEFEEYQLCMSPTAMNMRSGLAAFDPTEEEFRNMFRVQKQFDDEYGAIGRESSFQSLQYHTARKERDAQLRNILGEGRYAEYERSQDADYQDIYRITERNELPKDSAVKVYDLRKTAMDQANNVLKDGSLTLEQRAAALKGIRTDTENSIRTILGDKGWKSFQSQTSIDWLKNISPDPPQEP